MNKYKIKTLSIFFIFNIILYCEKTYAQNQDSKENEEYIHDKEIELTNFRKKLGCR